MTTIRPGFGRRNCGGHSGLHGPDAANTWAGRNHLTARPGNWCRGIPQVEREKLVQRDDERIDRPSRTWRPGNHRKPWSREITLSPVLARLKIDVFRIMEMTTVSLKWK